MPFDRPTLSALVTRTRLDAEARLTDGEPLLPVSNLAILSTVLAGAVHGLYGYLAWAAQQFLPDTAEADWLARLASIRGLSRVAATYAAGQVTFTGTSGAIVPTGSKLRRADGSLVATLVDLTLAGGTGTVEARAVLPGAAGNTAAATALTLVSAIAGVSSTASVATGGLAGGADGESDERLRERLLAIIRQPPMGGAAHDFIAWTLAAHVAVTRAWVYPRELGHGTVTVRLMTDGADGGDFPSDEVLDAVRAALEANRYVTADVTVVAPLARALDLVISPSPNTTVVQAAITAAIEDLLLREGRPAGLAGGIFPVSHLREAISTATGEADHVLVSPTTNIGLTVGQLLRLGTITWQ